MRSDTRTGVWGLAKEECKCLKVSTRGFSMVRGFLQLFLVNKYVFYVLLISIVYCLLLLLIVMS